MTDTNQKLREAFETYITDDGKWPNAILKAPGGQYLLLRTSVAWQDWKACAEALALPTAAPVGEREAFEAWLGITPCGAAHDFGWAAWKARAALSAGDAGWQPIETAPKVGVLLLCLPVSGNCRAEDRRVYESRWNEDQQTWTSVNGFILLTDATHWMPLPPAPAMRKGQL